jgi:hypothetical protein
MKVGDLVELSEYARRHSWFGRQEKYRKGVGVVIYADAARGTFKVRFMETRVDFPISRKELRYVRNRPSWYEKWA